MMVRARFSWSGANPTIFYFFRPDLGIVFSGLGQLSDKFSGMIWYKFQKSRKNGLAYS